MVSPAVCLQTYYKIQSSLPFDILEDKFKFTSKKIMVNVPRKLVRIPSKYLQEKAISMERAVELFNTTDIIKCVTIRQGRSSKNYLIGAHQLFRYENYLIRTDFHNITPIIVTPKRGKIRVYNDLIATDKLLLESILGDKLKKVTVTNRPLKGLVSEIETSYKTLRERKAWEETIRSALQNYHN